MTHSKLDDLEKINAKEMGEVIDMIKDIEETIYYHTIIEAMHHGGKTPERILEDNNQLGPKK